MGGFFQQNHGVLVKLSISQFFLVIEHSWFIVYCLLCLSTFHTLPSDSYCGFQPTKSTTIYPSAPARWRGSWNGFWQNAFHRHHGCWNLCLWRRCSHVFFSKASSIGGGFNFCFFNFTWGNDPIWLSICLSGLKPPTSYFVTLIFPSFLSWQGAQGFQHILFMSIPWEKTWLPISFDSWKGYRQQKIRYKKVVRTIQLGFLDLEFMCLQILPQGKWGWVVYR